MTEKRALVAVQGINSENYILHELVYSKFPREDYQKIVAIPTEEIFDRTIPDWIKVVPFLNKWYDQYYADLHAFFGDKEARINACRFVRNQIKALQNDGFTVDVIAHSLGTIITICSGPQTGALLQVNNFFCYNSPLGFGIAPGGMMVRAFVRKFMRNFIAKKLEYIYSSKDVISRDYKSAVGEIINQLGVLPKSKFDTLQDHKLSHNISERYSAVV